MVAAVALESVYAANHAALTALGYSPLPVGAGTKYPAIEKWQHGCDEMPSDAEHKAWSRKRGAGIGMACGYRVGSYQVIAIDLDVDGDDLDKLASALPLSPMEKVGRKGLTRFFRADPSIPKKAYNDANGHRLADRLAHGRMVALPPTIHPETGRPYVYTAGPVAASELPILSFDDIERFEDALESLGWSPDDDMAPAVSKGTGGASKAYNEGPCDYFRELNDRALTNLSAWVPTLGLHGLRQKRGGYSAVAHWRPSSSGRALEKRARNLSIVASGIVDFGDGDRGYSPIDLVVEATGWTFDNAAIYLGEKTGLAAELKAFCARFVANTDWRIERTKAREAAKRGEPHIIVAVDGTLHNTLTGQAFPPPPVRPPPPANDNVRDDDGLTWDDREANASNAMEWLVKGLFTRVGVSLLWGQSGAGKSFVALHLASCVLSGEAFFRHRVKAAGGTLFALGEAAGSMPDRLNALRTGTFGGDAPKHPETGEPIDLNRLPVSWMPVSDLAKDGPFRVFAENVRRAAAEMPTRHNVPLRLVVVDTMVAAFGFPEDPDASAVTKALKALAGLAEELGICIVAVHHAGKSKQAGEHGSYAWRGSVEASLQVDAERCEGTGAVTGRRLYVRKNRNAGNEGWNQPFCLKVITLGTDEDGDPITSAVVEPIGGVPNPHAATPAERRMTSGARRFMQAFNAVFEASASAMQTEDGDSVMAVMMRDVKDEYLRQNPGEADSMRRRCDRDLNEAFTANLVVPQGDRNGKIVWPTDGRATVAPEMAEDQCEGEAA